MVSVPSGAAAALPTVNQSAATTIRIWRMEASR
jgi:hypothetical protein